MALLIEQTSRDVPVRLTVVGAERTQVVVRPGDSFRFMDDSGKPVKAPGLKVRRLDNNLIIDGLPDGQVIELNNFFGACRPGAECTVALEGLGTGAAVMITEETPPVSALADGSFLLYTNNAATPLAALPAAAAIQSSGPSAGVIGAVAGGVLVAGVAGAGGGGGGDSGPVTDTTPPAAPIVTSGAVLKASEPIVTGEAEANARVILRIDTNGNGLFTDATDVTYVTTADANGAWRIDLRSAPQLGPQTTLTDGLPYGLLLQAVDAAQNASPSTRTVLTLDASPPAIPVIAAIAGDDILNAAERAAGVTVRGTAEPGASVTVTMGQSSLTTTADASGAFSALFTADRIPADGNTSVLAVATDAVGNVGPAATRLILVDTTAPSAPTVTSGAITNLTLPVLSGAAEAGSTVRISIDTDNDGSVQATYTVVASTAGAWSVNTATATPDGGGVFAGFTNNSLNGIATQATDTAGNRSAAGAATLGVDFTAPPAPVIATVATDDIVNAGERAAGVTVTGTLPDALYAGRPVTVSWGGVSVVATFTNPQNTAFQATFATGQLPADGPAAVTASYTSVGGGPSIIGQREVLVDTTPPAAPGAAPDLAAASDTGLSNTDNITSDTTPTFIVGAVPIGVAGVILYRDGSAVAATYSTSGGGTLTPDAAVPTSASPQSFTYAWVDTAGNVSAPSPALAVTVNTAGPAAPATAPDLVAASDTGVSATDNITADTTPTFLIGALPSGVTGVILYRAGAPVAATYAAGSGGTLTPDAAIPSSAVAQSFTYAYVDTAGNTSSQSPALSVVVNAAGPAAPSVAPDLLTASDSGASSTDNITNDTTPVFVVGALPVGVIGATLYVAGVEVASTYAPGGGGTLTPTAALAAPGTPQNVTFAWVDATGTTSAQSQTLPVTIDTVAPATPGVAPDLVAASDTGVSDTDNITADTTPTFLIGALPSDASGAVLYLAGAPIAATYAAGGGGTITPNAAVPSSASAQNFTYAFVDAAGNTSGQSPALAVVVNAAGPTAPGAAPDLLTASDSGALSNDNITNVTTPIFQIGALPVGVTGARLYVAGVEVAATYAPGGGGTLTPNAALAAPGTPQDITFAWVDSGGNTSAQSPALAVTIDTTAPATPGTAPDLAPGSDTGISSTDNITTDTTPTFLIGALPPGASDAVLYLAGTPIAAAYASSGGGTLTATAAVPSSATAQNFTYALVDAAGNTSGQSPALAVVVNTAGPAAPSAAPDLVAGSDTGVSATDNITNDTTPTFQLGLRPSGAESATLYVAGVEVAATYLPGAGTLTPTTALTATGTPRDFTFAWVDAGGGTSAQSAALAVTIDTAAPAPTFTFTVQNDSLAPTLTTIAHNNVPATTDTTPRVTLTLSSVLAVGETITLVSGVTTIATITGTGAVPAPVVVSDGPLDPGANFYSASSTDLAGNTGVLDLNVGASGQSYLINVA
jgi:hypothetical protein